ncbi:hypothetical protein ACGFSB_13260 [Streptomyces sp. NPDC048441]|uniref:hypothetical protein n=1 Tax=Streptomyces sp. NPDC048441 TaxID=3365552 RepID=UPI00371B2091
MAEQHLGCRAVRAALAEVVLHRPHRAEADPVREPDLFHGLAVGALLGGALAVRMGSVPGLRYVDLVQHIEVHCLLPPSRPGCTMREI